ncbi:hypothetical protein JOC36_001101 [Weissella uvarum]|uniref:hypothetical protein n=1 Tax=Weissella uvarum TaxID=1479233 RepID=UPI001960213D|nr:hypothetical protein [Weissella uvarum]MBM7617544.1 hypothetical protein [Weissella uvarum]MCM0595574.1 hypothetical protein [Weissella uvarum]
MSSQMIKKAMLLTAMMTGLSLGAEAIVPVKIEARLRQASPKFKGYRISWAYGRKPALYSYSAVQTGRFKHSATANQTYSGLKRKGVRAVAQQYVGWGRATAYWHCQ